MRVRVRVRMEAQARGGCTQSCMQRSLHAAHVVIDHIDIASMLCFGCGCDLSSRPKDRRDLLNPSSIQVVTTWKELMVQRSYSESEMDSLLRGVGGSGKMCRKCFTSYSHAATLLATLKSNLLKFIDSIDAADDDEPTATKFPRLSGTPSTAAPGLHSMIMQSGSTTSSPPVYVRVILILPGIKINTSCHQYYRPILDINLDPRSTSLLLVVNTLERQLHGGARKRLHQSA